MIVVALQQGGGSGGEDSAASTPNATTPGPAATASTSAPTPFAVLPSTLRTGIAAVDAAMAALTTQNQAQLLALLHYADTPCVIPGSGIGGGPECTSDQTAGTMVQIVGNAGCEGGVQFKPQVPKLPSRLADAIQSPKGIYAVAQLLPNLSFSGKYLIVFSDPTSGAGSTSGALYVDDLGITGVAFGCFATPKDALSSALAAGFVQELILSPLN
jgi:hypothetical protein